MTDPGQDRRRALGDFLRAKREHLTPAQCGLPTGPRRRTPGLRREEVAELCGMSATWYIWIEQGRDVQASPAVLARLAEALRMSNAERAYLFRLAGRSDPNPPDGGTDSAPHLPDALHLLLRQAGTFPAYVLDRYWNACAWNKAAEHLFAGWLDQDGERNLLAWIFTHPQASTIIQDWSERSHRVVSEFRADCASRMTDPVIKDLIDWLSLESADFVACWNDQTVLSREGGTRRFDHPELGPQSYQQLTLTLASHPDIKVVVLTQGDEVSTAIPLS